LDFIEQNRTQTPYWVGSAPNVRNITLEKERVYEEMLYPTEGYRLLSLFRFWNIIHYFFPYKNIIGRDWNGVLDEFIPKFSAAKDTSDYHLACREVINTVNDSHASYTPPAKNLEALFGRYSVPFSAKIIGNQVVVTYLKDLHLCNLDDIKIGDAITMIDGKPITELVQKLWYMASGSNDVRKLKFLATTIFLGHTPQYQLTFERDGKTTVKTSNRHLMSQMNFSYADDYAKPFKELNDDIGYIHMGVLKREQVDSMYNTLSKKKALIFDVRNYPKGAMYEIVKKLKPKSSPFVQITKPYILYPGLFKWDPPLNCGSNNPDYYKGKVIILCDESTQSHAEFTIMSLQTAPNVVTIGSQTSGADGNVSTIILVGGGKCYMTGTGIFYPDGTQTQRVGIKVDIEVKPTLKGIREGRDEVLEKAIELSRG
jgi:carboxyl-terminal processing protease